MKELRLVARIAMRAGTMKLYVPKFDAGFEIDDRADGERILNILDIKPQYVSVNNGAGKKLSISYFVESQK